MNKDKILKLCDEIENTLSDAWNSNEIDYELAGHIVSFAKKIAAEITAPPKSNADRIRQMTDEELADVMQGQCECCVYQLTGCTEKECKDGAYKWLKQEVSEEDTLTAFCPDCGTYMSEEGADNANN